MVERLFKPKLFLVIPVIVALLIAPLLTFVAPQSVKAATPDGWVNRYTINYGGRIFIDANTYDGNREYIGPAETDGCPPDSLTFLGPGAVDDSDHGAFFYSESAEGIASSPASYKQYEKVRNDVTEECQIRETGGPSLQNAIANVKNRRIVMYLDPATDKIHSLYNASVVFERAGNASLGSNSYARYARVGDTETCRDLIVNARSATLDGGDWFSGNRVADAWVLYAVSDNSPSGNDKLSETYSNVVPGTQRVCQGDFSDGWKALGASGYGLTSNDDPDEGFLVVNGLDGAGNPAGGDGRDDAFAIFIGNTDNIMPAGSGNSGTPNQCQIPGKNNLPKDHPDCKSATPQVCTVGEQGLASALAWIICPITALISDFTQFVENNIIIPYLTVNPLVATTDTSDPRSIPYRLWDGFRNLANVGFIIGFFIIIFTTALGNFNYGIKRMLPKFFVLIILTNISFFLVAFAIDVFNLIGAGIGGFAANTVLQPLYQDPKFAAAYPTPNAGQIFALLGGLIAAIALTGGGALGWLFGLLLAAALVIAVAVIVLVVRQVLILALTAVFPLILLAFMLPNLENYGRKGVSAMGNLLAMYPAIVLLFAAGKVGATLFALPATAAIISPGGGTASNEVTDAVRVTMMFLATVLPLGALPFLMVAMGGILGKAYSAMRNAGQRAQAGVGKAYENSRYGKFRAQKRDERNARIMAGSYRGAGGNLNPRNLRASANRGLNQNRLFNAATGGYGGSRAVLDRAARAKERKETIEQFGGDTALAKAWALSGGDTSHKAYRDLASAQQQAFQQLRQSGRQRSADSFIAAQEFIAGEGEGDRNTLYAAQQTARKLGASEVDIAGLGASSVAAWRGKGRGDIQSTLNPDDGTVVPGGTGGWGSIRMENLSRHALDDTAKQADFARFYHLSGANAQSVLLAYSKMEGRAQEAAAKALDPSGAGNVNAGKAFIDAERQAYGINT